MPCCSRITPRYAGARYGSLASVPPWSKSRRRSPSVASCLRTTVSGPGWLSMPRAMTDTVLLSFAALIVNTAVGASATIGFG